MKSKCSYLCLLIIMTLLWCCKGSNNNMMISNNEPKNKSKDALKLRLLHQIDIGAIGKAYQILNASWFEVDENGNLYILDSYSSKIHIFNSDGLHIKTFGDRGQGPIEMQMPICISIKENRLYVLEQFRGIKIFSLNGEYIDYIPRIIDYMASFKASPSGFIAHTINLSFEKPIMGEPDVREWGYIKLSNEFKKEKDIVKIKNKFNYFNNYVRTNANAIDKEGYIYLPVSDDKYQINKYDQEGNNVLSFSRQYKRAKYSKELREWAMRRWKGEIEVPSYPPIIRCIYTDDKDYIWVIVGEYYEDSASELKYNSEIDIFNSDGIYINNLKTDIFSNISIIKNGRLYSGPNSTGDNKIKVYDIIYNIE